MIVEWDARKAQANQIKHGLSFEEAATVFRDPMAVTFDDPQHSLEERRFITVGHTIKQRFVLLAHCDRGDAVRLISARPATRKERRQYEERFRSG